MKSIIRRKYSILIVARVLFLSLLLQFSFSVTISAQSCGCDGDVKVCMVLPCINPDPSCNVFDHCEKITFPGPLGDSQVVYCVFRNICAVQYYFDGDGDGYYSTTISSTINPGIGWSTFPGLGGGDCDDNNIAINPGATEICGNGVDDNCDGRVNEKCDKPEIFVRDLKIDTILGVVKKLSFEGVTVKALKGEEVIETVTSDQEGLIHFLNLEESTFYDLSFHYEGADGLTVDYKYNAGYTLGNNLTIDMPYSLLQQLREIEKNIRTKAPYEQKYFSDFLNLESSGFAQREIYDVSQIDQLVHGWQKLESANADLEIESLERTCLALWAMDKFSENNYELCHIPAKANAEIAMGIAEAVMGFIELYEEAGSLEYDKVVTSDIIDFMNDIFSKVIEKITESATEVLSENLEALDDDDPKRISLGVKIVALKTINVALQRFYNEGAIGDASKEALKNIAKDVINKQLFILVHKRYMNKTQPIINEIYKLSKIPAYAEDDFEAAFDRVRAHNLTSLVDVCKQRTEDTLDLVDNVFFKNVDDFEEFSSYVEDGFEFLGKIKEVSEAFRNKLKFLRIISLIPTIYTYGNYALADYAAWKRMNHLELEQIDIPNGAFVPASIPLSSLNAKKQIELVNTFFGSDKNTLESSGFSFIELVNAIEKYNSKSKEVLTDVMSNDIHAVIRHSTELWQYESMLNETYKEAKARLNSVAPYAKHQVHNFEKKFVEEFSPANYEAFAFRASSFMGIMNYLLDTTQEGYKDTLTNLIQQAQVKNLNALAKLMELYEMINGLTIPGKVMIKSSDAPKRIRAGEVGTYHFTLKNYGDNISHSIYTKLEIDGGFIPSADSLYIGDLLPGEERDIKYSITTPIVDTFTIFILKIFSSDALGTVFSGNIVSKLPITISSSKNWICHNERIILSANNVNGMRIQWYRNDTPIDGSIYDTVHITAPAKYRAERSSLGIRESSDAVNIALGNGMIEVCGNKIDDNCNGFIDEECSGLPTLETRTYPLKEGNIGLTNYDIKVMLDRPAILPVNIGYNTSDDEAIVNVDYMPSSGLLTILPGKTSGTIRIQIKNDLLREKNERFNLNFSNPQNVSFDGIPKSSVMIIDDDNKQANNSFEKSSYSGNSLFEENDKNSNHFTSLYPNPANQKVNLKLDEIEHGKVNIQFFDQTGRLVKKSVQIDISKGQVISLNTAGFLDGLYLVVIKDGYGNRIQHKLVIQH